MDNSLIYISLLNWQKYEECIACVRSLEKLNYQNFKILIRDNNSPNDSVAQLKKALPNYKVYTNHENRGYAAGHLENWKIARTKKVDFFWILNCDLEVFSDTLSQLIKITNTEPNAILGSLSLSANNNNRIDFGGGSLSGTKQNPISYNTWKNHEYSKYINLYPEYREVQSVEGSSIFIPSKIIENNGFMKTDFFMYGEETDYCLSLRKKGIKSILVSQSKIIHHGASSFKADNQLSHIPVYYRRRNYLRIMREYFGWSLYRILNYKGSVWSKLKFGIKSIIFPSTRITNKEDYYLLLATFHALIDKRDKIVSPEKHATNETN